MAQMAQCELAMHKNRAETNFGCDIERARSISPTKDSPVLDPARLSISSVGSRPIDPPEHLEPTTRTTDLETMNKPDSPAADYSSTPTEGGNLDSPKGNEYEMDTSPTRPAPPTFSRSRTGTLSWQQRPSSRDISGRSLFSPTSPTRTNRLRSRSTVNNENQAQEPPRDQNTHAWSANDTPPGPRQTTDRSGESPTQPKNTVEELPGTTLNSYSTQEAPETALERTPEPEKQPSHQNPVDERSRSPSRASSTFGDSSLGNRYSSMSSVSTATGLGSPLPQSSAQRFEPRKAEPGSEEQTPPSPTQRRLSPERPSSPTKGLGGFVQSAMMKRSDSVSKRWSAQLPSGLNRTNSVASNRNSIAVPDHGDSLSTSSSKSEKEGPSLPPHRPSSSHSEATVVHNRRGSERPSTPPVPGNSDNTKTEEGSSRPSLTLHARSPSKFDKEDQNTDPNPTSPVVSRTMDPKRWSPTKATWLESALNRPDSPRHRKQPSQQAYWTRDRQSKGSVDLGRKNSFKEVTPIGLMRSVPPGGHYKKPSSAGMPDLLGNLDANRSKEPSSSEPVSSSKQPVSDSKGSNPLTMDTAEKKEEPRQEEPQKDEPALSPEKSPEENTSPEATPSDQVPDRRPPPLSLTPTPNIAPSPSSAREQASPKPKAQSPVIDFRANLRKREVVKDNAPKEEPEFKNVFGRLRRTETSSYVPSDDLRDNIRKGRAALSATSGPKKSSKEDDLKESIMKQKEVRSGAGLSRRNTATENDAPSKSLPEAIAKRQNLTKSNSVKSTNSPSSPSPVEPDTPDLASQKSPFPSFENEEDIEKSDSVQITPALDRPSAQENDQPAVQETQPQAADPVFLGHDEPSPEIKHDEPEEQPKKYEREAKQENSNEEATQPVRALPSESIAAVASAPAATQGPAAKGNKLAGRINPALAGLLSRGPPAAGGDGPKKSLSSCLSAQSGSESSDAPSGTSLTHMTKNRVRGPRRRQPGATGGQMESSAGQAEASIEQPEPSFTHLEPTSNEPGPSVAEPEPEPSAPKDMLSANEPEPFLAHEPPAPKDERPAAQPEPSASELEFPEFEQEESLPKQELPAAQPESPVIQHETLASEPEPSVPEVKSPILQPESPVAPRNEPVSPQPEPFDPKEESSGALSEPSVSGPAPSVSETELSAPKDESYGALNEVSVSETEPSVAEVEQSAPKNEPHVTRSELSAPKDELPAAEPLPPISQSGLVDHESTREEGPAATPPETAVPRSEPSATQLEALPNEKESSVTEDKLPKDEPFDAPLELPTGQPDVLSSKLEPSVPEELSVPQSIRTPSEAGSSIVPSQSSVLSAPKEESAASDQGSTFDSAGQAGSTSSVDHSIGDSNSNWPLPDSQPVTIGSAQSDHSPLSARGLRNLTHNEPKPQQENATPQSKMALSAFPPKSSDYYEDVENIPDTPSRRPAVPPKSPRTPSDQRWSPRAPYLSQTPSPLRTSYKENRMESPVSSPQQRSFAGFLGRNKSLPSPPVPPKRSDTQNTQISSPRSSSSLVPLADESMEVISDFFKTFPRTSDRVDIDPQLMLTSRNDDLKIRTVKKQVWEITGDNKRQDLPINQEYILYQGSMYLCVHTFESDGHTRSEAHLWCGDDVPDNAVDDAQTFSRKTAKENGCKLEIIKQGKEPARFIHALGGILITRRGYNSRSSLSAIYMLCGRKHLKQMVFDEVDFSRGNLCSGFPFVISAPFGKLYLWKGKGSSAEEIGAARLIGMDLGLTGEFEEVTEGEEPESFFEIFSFRDTDRYMRSDYWKLKPNHEHFRCRLLRVDHELGQKSGFWIRRPGSSSPIIRPNDTVQEIEPYRLKDITAKGIYILDTYFELYV